MARRFLALDFREYEGDPVKEARFFGVLPFYRGGGTGLREEKYLWGKVFVLSRKGRKEFFRFAHYTPSSQAARTAFFRYVFYEVLKSRGYRLKGRIGEVLVFISPEGGTVFLAAKWGGYTPAGVRRVFATVSPYVYQTGGKFWFVPVKGRRYGRFLKSHPVAEVIPAELVEAAEGLSEVLARGEAPSLVVRETR